MNDEPETPPVESWKRKTNIGAIASLSIIFAAVIVIAIAALWLKIPVADLVGYFVLILGIVILSVLSNRYIFIDVAVRRFVSGYFRFTGWMLISLGPLVVFNALSRYVLSNLLFRYQHYGLYRLGRIASLGDSVDLYRQKARSPLQQTSTTRLLHAARLCVQFIDDRDHILLVGNLRTRDAGRHCTKRNWKNGRHTWCDHRFLSVAFFERDPVPKGQ